MKKPPHQIEVSKEDWEKLLEAPVGTIGMISSTKKAYDPFGADRYLRILAIVGAIIFVILIGGAWFK
jgi:hypothetical protein